MHSPAKDQEGGALKGILLIIVAGILWGTTGTSQALGPETSNPLAVGSLRLLIGGIALAIIAVARGGFRTGGWSIPLVFFGGFLVAFYQVTFFSAVAQTGVAVGTIVGIGSAPIFAGFLELFVLRKNPGKFWVYSTFLALLGVALLVFSSDTSATGVTVNVVGILLATCAGLSYASYTLVIKLLLRYKKADEVTAAVFCAGAVIISPLLFFSDISWLNSFSGWGMMLHLGILATALSYLLFVEGLKTVPVSSAVTLALTEPLTAGILGVAVLGEKLSLNSTIGLLLVFSGVVLLIVSKRKL